MRRVLSIFSTGLLCCVAASLLLVPGSGLLAAPDLSVTKSCIGNGGQAILCTVTVTNIGNVPSVAPMSITDTIASSSDANLTGVGGTLPASCTPGAQLINNIAVSCPSINSSLAPSASETLLISYSMPQGGNFTNCVSVSQAQNAATPGDPNAANNTNICTTFSVSAPPPATGSITITKDAQPDDAQDFTFTSNVATIAPFPLDDDSDPTLSNTRTFSSLAVGNYSFTETQVSGWTLSSLVCTGGSATTNATTGTATIALAAGDNVTCTYVNVKTTGSITIIKDAQPNDAQDFTFTSNVAAIAPFPLDDDSDPTLLNTRTFASLPAGSYSFTETQVSGWTLSSLVCTGGTATTNTGSLTANITLAAGDNVTCIFTNSKVATATLTIIKDAQPDNAQDFHFTTVGTGLTAFDLDDDGVAANPLSNSITFTNLTAGIPFTVTEDAVSGWTVPSIQCLVAVPGQTTTFTDQLHRTFSVNLEAGANVTCTFINVKTTGSITIIKDAQPNDAQDFTFTSNVATIAPFPLDDDSDPTLSNTRIFASLAAGTYSFTETQVSGWTLSSLVCTGGSATTSVTSGTASIALAAGDNVTCTFTNSKALTGTLTIIKDAQPDNAQGFHFATTGTGLSPFDLDDDGIVANPLSNAITFTNLAAGIPFTVTEDAVSGWTVPSIQCLVGVPGLTTTFTDQLHRTFTVTLEAGANVTCTFINVKTTGSITIIKDAQPNDAQDFTFTSNVATIAPFPLDDDSDPTLSNTRTFASLPGGTYSFTETQVSGWLLTSVVCTGGTTTTSTATATATIALVGDENVSCTFTNVKRTPTTGKICGVKFNDLNGDGIQNAGDLGLANWQISVGIASIPPVVTGSKGEFCFNDVPAGSYTIGELQQTPWQQTFPQGNYNLTLQAGQVINGINFGNTLPAGKCSPLVNSPYSLLTNGDFELAPLVSANTFSFFNQSLMQAWKTSASDGLIEVWGTNFGSVPAYSGNQFIELNATGGATVYQNFTAAAGSTLKITFAHRGRAGFANKMSVAIGELGHLPTPLGSFTATVGVWTQSTVTWNVPLNGGSTYQLGFTSSDNAAGGNLLDGVHVIDQACATSVIDVGATLTGLNVFEYMESSYPLDFNGVATPGQSGKYNYRFYKTTGNYLAIDDLGDIYMQGPASDNAIKRLGSINEFRSAILAWNAGPLTTVRVFAYAEANFPDLFKGTSTVGQLEQYSYRFYVQTGNYLAVDNAGVIYLLGPASGNKLMNLGSVESFRDKITIWYANLKQ